MNSMKEIYGSVFAYDKIVAGGLEKLQDTIYCGGLHIQKSKIIMSMLEQVWERHGKWDLDYLFEKSDEDAMQELMRYKGMGPKSAFVVMSWCLKRNPFTVDTHPHLPHRRALGMEAQGGDSRINASALGRDEPKRAEI
jgi:endonuclease-3